jgi:hypothetical protein
MSKDILTTLSSEKIFERGLQLKDKLQPILEDEGEAYVYTIDGTQSKHSIMIYIKQPYATCVPCTGFTIRSMCSHMVAALLKIGETEDEESLGKVIKWLSDKHINKGNYIEDIQYEDI